MRVRDFMRKDVITVDENAPIMAALETMKHNKIKRLPATISPDLPVEEAIWLGKKQGIGGFPLF